MKHVYNCFGECIDNVKAEFISDEFGYYDENGSAHAYFSLENENVDSRGFDKKHMEPNGRYTREVELPKGTMLCRYGATGGKTTSFVDEPYENMGLPYKKETIPYHEYLVIADGVSVKCVVTKGIAAKMFNSSGGAVQFVHYQTIADELKDGKIKEVFTWLEKKN